MQHKRRKARSGSKRLNDPRDCVHNNLIRVESDIDSADADVLLYRCSTCQKVFTITEY